MFPTVVFRQAYDRLCATEDRSADAHYLQVLELAATHGESEVADLLCAFLRACEVPRPELIAASLKAERPAPSDVAPFVPDLKTYDSLLTEVSA